MKKNIPKQSIQEANLKVTPTTSRKIPEKDPPEITAALFICLAGLLIFVSSASTAFALEPDQILIIANSSSPASLRIARYYCQKRNVPEANILALSLPDPLAENIDRADYEKMIAQPIREELSKPDFIDKIKCLLTVYGVPYKVGPRGILETEKANLTKLMDVYKQKSTQQQGPASTSDNKNSLEPHNLNKPSVSRREFAKAKRLIKQAERQDWNFGERIEFGFYDAIETVAGIKGLLLRLDADIDNIKGIDTDASLDSELSMVMLGHYPLYREQPNELNQRIFWLNVKTLMVSRLDGPGEDIAVGLIDRAVAAERNGLKGTACIDSGHSLTKPDSSLYKNFDRSLLKTVALLEKETDLQVKHEMTENLFAPGACPQTAIYCGWYSLKKYIDAFDFVDGAIGFHIASFEAIDLRDINSTQWCPAMLRDGVTATLGAVDEPYLAAFPDPKKFFAELLKGKTLAEAFYKTKPFNSWRMVLIGDPLYRPFQ